MLTLNEGMPRSGKSYDAIKNHVLPALKNGREVYARLNLHPDSHERIAQFLGQDVSEIRRLLHVVNSNEVLPMFACTQDATGEWVLPEKFHNALIIIDECHEFYVSGKTPLPKEQHTFFAMHGHYGADVLLMSQSFKDCHSGIRRRVERKTCFQKLSAVGMDGRYLATHYNSTAPERYEKVESVTHVYEPEYFPLYKGFKEGAKTGVYGGGNRTLLQSLAVPVILGALVLGACTWAMLHFWGAEKAAPPVVAMAPKKAADVEQNMEAPAVVEKRAVEQKEKVEDGLTAPQRYVSNLAKKGRARLAAVIERADGDKVLVEWRDNGNNVIERLSSAQLRAMGVGVEVASYGVLLTIGRERTVATSWPATTPSRDSSHALYDTSGGRAAPMFSPPLVASAETMGASQGASSPRIGNNQAPIIGGAP